MLKAALQRGLSPLRHWDRDGLACLTRPLLILIQTASLANVDLIWFLTGESREIPDLDLHDRARAAVLDELPKLGLPATSGRAVKLAGRAYENPLARSTTPGEEALRLAPAWE